MSLRTVSLALHCRLLMRTLFFISQSLVFATGLWRRTCFSTLTSLFVCSLIFSAPTG